jgi:non-canonical purine NTP pyrophosphatase (RdgB/HAM1 family)
MINIHFLSGNEDKIKEVQATFSNYPDIKIKPIKLEVDIEEIQGTAKEIIEAKIQKVRDYCDDNKDVNLLCEDTSLYFVEWSKQNNNQEWEGLPGPYIKAFMSKEIGCEKLIQMTASFTNKRAVAVCHFALSLANDPKNVIFFTGICNGEIVDRPRGSNGFGWDSIFKPDGCDKTFAEFTFEEKIQFETPRKMALKKLFKHATTNSS